MRWIEDIGVRRIHLRRNLAMFWQLTYLILRGRDSDPFLLAHYCSIFLSEKVSYTVEIIT